MTYIEFFDKNAAENICACLAQAPDRVVLVGSSQKTMEKHAKRYRALFLARRQEVEFQCRGVNKNNMADILTELTKLVETYDDCVFGLTGGDELYLTAVGIISERYKEKNIQMHRFNIANGAIIDCDQDGKTILQTDDMELTVEENIRIYGGDIIYDTIKAGGTYLWDIDEEFLNDIGALWKVFREAPHLWNRRIGVLKAAAGRSKLGQNGLTAAARIAELRDWPLESDGTPVFSRDFAMALYRCGVLTACEYDERGFCLTFKNRQLKKCLTKEGQLLEMFVYKSAMQLQDSKGKAVYNDVMNGVCIDWDGRICTEKKSYDTKNEVDVMLMHGIVPVFVSCKNGDMDANELYKLNAVAEAFGGRYAKKVLIVTHLDTKDDQDKYIRQRAIDMKIRLVEGIQSLQTEVLEKILRSLWLG